MARGTLAPSPLVLDRRVGGGRALARWRRSRAPRRACAGGTTIAGVDVGGLARPRRRRQLEQRAAAVERRPSRSSAGERPSGSPATQLGVRPTGRGAVAAAQERGDGFAPVQGLRRIGRPPLRRGDRADRRALPVGVICYTVSQIAAASTARPRDASLGAGGSPVVVPAPRRASPRPRRLATRRSSPRSPLRAARPVALPVGHRARRSPRPQLGAGAAQARTAVRRR